MSNLSSETLIRQIHDAPPRLVLVLAGGGSRALAELLEMPGASRTVIEAAVPYSAAAMIDWLGGRPDSFCSAPTARAMGVAAMLRARALAPDDDRVAGLACTASLASDHPKRGPHRAHVVVQTVAETVTYSLELLKGQRSRADEERLVSLMVLNAAAEACGLDARLELPLRNGEAVQRRQTVAPLAWQELLLGRTEAVLRGGESGDAEGDSPIFADHRRPSLRDGARTVPAKIGTVPDVAILSGAFNPLHAGHRRMAEVARKILGAPVAMELSILNVDKPPLDYTEIEQRLDQFAPDESVWITRAATFEQKSRLFAGATFVVGVDTMRRIALPQYHGGDPQACLAALQRIAQRGCRFLVFGRVMGTSFVRLSDLDLPPVLREIAQEVPAEQFREDVSSTAIRRGSAQ